jgi:hypothetical protein
MGEVREREREARDVLRGERVFFFFLCLLYSRGSLQWSLMRFLGKLIGSLL